MRPYYTHAENGLEIVKVEVGTFENNVYLIRDPAAREAYVIDAGYEPDAVADLLAGYAVRGIFITHGHQDHHEEVARLRERLDAPVAIGRDDADLLSIPPDRLIQDGDRFPLGESTISAIHTPGHTPGSTCFLLGNRLFTGDTLFPGGPGNTRRDPQRFAMIVQSIRERLFTLPDETTVCPGHGRDTTIGAEKPHLAEWIARGW